MAWQKWLGQLGKALAKASAREKGGPPVGPGDTGKGAFAERLGGVTLRQFIIGDPGGSTEKVLAMHPDGQFVYHETSQHEGGFVRTDPEYGTWSAAGDFPVGEVRLSWVGGGTTRHVIEYHGGNTCLFDGVTTMVR